MNMKIHHINNGLRLAAATMLAIALTYTSFAAETKTGKGGASELMSKPIRTADDLQGLQAGDMMVMSCSKCKDVTVSYVEPTFKATESKDKVRTQHTCPGCNNIITVEGHGKAKKDVMTHVCKTCGSKDAFCCVVKGPGPTKGMEKKAVKE